MDMDDTLPFELTTCYLCHKILVSGVTSIAILEAMSICEDCKLLFLEHTDTNTLTQHTTPTSSYNNSSSPEFIQNILSQDFPDNINLSRHRQWRRVLSDSESDEDFDSDSYENYDTYTDPIHDDENTHESLMSGARLRRSFATNGRNRPLDWLSESNGMYVDGEIERVGPHPASVSFVKSLENVVVVKNDDVEGMVCVICKESVSVGSVVNRLPCLHVYHGLCIIPWLNIHNTCPLCRYKLPTDGDCERPDITQAVVVGSENVSGGGGGWWWFVVGPLVSMVGVGVMLWLGRGLSFVC